MAFDILGFYNKHKDYYGDAPLDKVAKDVYTRAGYDKEYSDFDTWAKQEGVDQHVQDDLKRRNPPKEGSALGALGKTLLSVPENLAASAITAIQGGGGASINDRGIGDKFVNWVTKRNEELSKEYEGTGDVIPGVISKQDIAQLGQNLGFSGVSMVAGAAGGVAGAPGGPGGIFAGRMLGAGAAAHRMQSYQTMNDWLNRKNEESIKLHGRGINPEEETALKGLYEGLASKSGLYEAVPEGIGTAAELALILAKNKVPGGKLIPDSVIKKLAKGAVKLGKIIGIEEATETVTQMGQHNVEVEAGMTSEPKREWTSPEDWLTSAKEVFPAVLLLSGFIGGAGAVYQRLQAVEDNPPELEREINKLKIGALATSFIDQGMKVGTVDGDPFTPENALEIIREGQNSGIYDSDSLERFKERYPQLRDGLNGVIADSIIRKIDEVASPEPRPDSISQTLADMERIKKIIPARNTEEDVPEYTIPEEEVPNGTLQTETPIIDQQKLKYARKTLPYYPAQKPSEADIAILQEARAKGLLDTDEQKVLDKIVKPAEEIKPLPTAETSPIEAPNVQAEKNVEPAATPEGNLLTEALKYKSADEFVQAQTPYYHGTHGDFETFKPFNEVPEEFRDASGQKTFGTYFADNKDLAGKFGKNVMERNLDVHNPIDLSKVQNFDELTKALGDDTEENAFTLKRMKADSYFDEFTSGDNESPYRALEALEKKFNITQKLQERGHDALIFADKEGTKVGKTTVVFDVNKIKTKSQLTEIWNKAHEGKPSTLPAPLSQTDAATVGVKEVKSEESSPDFNEMVKEAQRWRGAAYKVDASLGDDKKARLAHSQMTTKADLDRYLMKKFGIDEVTARNISNELTAKNLKPNDTAKIEDFAGEPWAKVPAAPKPPEDSISGKVEAAGEVKEPWEMSAEEVGKQWPNPEGDASSRSPWMMPVGQWSAWEAGAFKTEAKEPSAKQKEWHRGIVRDAVREGKPVPESVLKDYPDLAPKKAEGVSSESQIIPYSKDLKITNTDSMPKGVGARYILAVKGENGELVAKQWKRDIPKQMSNVEVLVDFKPEPTTKGKVKEPARIVPHPDGNGFAVSVGKNKWVNGGSGPLGGGSIGRWPTIEAAKKGAAHLKEVVVSPEATETPATFGNIPEAMKDQWGKIPEEQLKGFAAAGNKGAEIELAKRRKQNEAAEPAEIFIRKAERKDLGRIQKSLREIPAKEGYEVVYKPSDKTQGKSIWYKKLKEKVIKVDNSPKKATESKNLAQFIIAIGKVRLGSFTSKTGTAWDRAHGKRGKDQSREMGVIKAVASINGKFSMDEAASMANLEGYRDRDGQPFTDVTLFRELAEGDARKVLRPDLQESKMETEIEEKENEWITEQLAKLEENEFADAIAGEGQENIKAVSLDEIEAQEGDLTESELALASHDADDFFAAIAENKPAEKPAITEKNQTKIEGTDSFNLTNPETEISKGLPQQVTPKNEDLFAEEKKTQTEEVDPKLTSDLLADMEYLKNNDLVARVHIDNLIGRSDDELLQAGLLTREAKSKIKDIADIVGVEPRLKERIDKKTAELLKIAGYDKNVYSAPDHIADAAKMVEAEEEPAKPKPLRMDGTTRPERKKTAPLAGFDSLPQSTKDKFNAAFESKDTLKMQEYLDLPNKNLRAEFENRTGAKLPNTVKGTDQAVSDYFAEPSEQKPEAKEPWQMTKEEGKADGLRYDPATNRHNGTKLTRGDVLVDNEGNRYALDRDSGFTLTAARLDENNKESGLVSFSVDPTDKTRFLNVRIDGTNLYKEGQPENSDHPITQQLLSIKEKLSTITSRDEAGAIDKSVSREIYDEIKRYDSTLAYNLMKKAEEGLPAALALNKGVKTGKDSLYQMQVKDLNEVLDRAIDRLRKETGQSKAIVPAASKSGKEDIQDFGEKLGGARKDRSESFKKEYTDSDIASLPLSKIWPKSEVDAIEDKFVAAFAFAARGAIPTKPQLKYKVSRWVEKVKAFRGMMSDLFKDIENGAYSRGKILDKSKSFSSLKGFFAKIRLLEAIDREQWDRIGDVNEYPDAYRYSDKMGDDGKYEHIPAPSVSVYIDGRYKSFEGLKSVEESIEQVNEALGKTTPIKSDAIKGFEVRGSGDRYFINKKGDSQYHKLKEFKTSKEALDFRNEHPDELLKAWDAVKELENVAKEDVRTKENRPRAGKDHRAGKDVTPQQFIDTFGFRGVEFGNWVAQGSNAKERQGMLNDAYDAMMDLADIIGIPPKAISLNGTLGLGFGSRGHGGAAAHYEPDTIVINLTKTKGSGTFAHEFFHALDNYFQRARGIEGVTREKNYITYSPETYYQEKGGARLSASRYNEILNRRGLKPENWTKIEGVRPEVAEAFKKLVETLDNSPMSERVSHIKNKYWSRIIERAARSFENYVIVKMAKQGYQNDYLANVVRVEDFKRMADRYPYLYDSEIAPVEDAFDKLFDTIQTRETDKGVAMYQRKGTTSSGLQQSAVQSIINKAVTAIPNAPKVNVVQGNENCPDEVQKIMEQEGIDDAMGFTYKGEVYLVSDNLQNTEEALRTLAHELTHSGLGKFFQRQRMSRALVPVRAQYEALMDAIYRAHHKEIEQITKTTHTHLNTRTAKDRRQACEEWLCNQSYEAQPKWYDKLVAIFHDLLRAIGLDVKLSDAEVRVVLQDAFKEFGGEGVNFKIAHHGTPHVWMPEPGFPHGRPRLDKIGTGEGAAAFGWGWYSAEAEVTGKAYLGASGQSIDVDGKIYSGTKKPLEKQTAEEMAVTIAANSLLVNKSILMEAHRIRTAARIAKNNPESLTLFEKEAGWDQAEKLNTVADILDKWANADVKIANSLYKLEIPDDVIPKLLDWDKPLSEQSEYIKILLGKNVNLVPGDVTHDIYTKTGKRLAWARGEEEKAEWERQGYVLRPVKPLDAKGSRYYEHLTQKFGSQKAASKYLASIGIPGNKYLDQMSRNYNIIDNQMKVAYDNFNGDAEAAADYLVQYLHDTPEEKSKARQNYINKFKRGYTYNYVIWDQKVLDRIALLERNGEKLDAIREEQEQEVPIEFQRSPVRRSQPMFSRSDNPNYKWWEGMDIQKQLESLPLKFWQKPRNFIAMGYVPITRAEADQLYYDGLDIFVAHVNIRGELDTTGNEGIFMRPLSFYGYQYRRYDGTRTQETEATNRYLKYRERYLQGRTGEVTRPERRETVPVSEEAPERKVAESENRYSGTQGKGTANIPPETTPKAEDGIEAWRDTSKWDVPEFEARKIENDPLAFLKEDDSVDIAVQENAFRKSRIDNYVAPDVGIFGTKENVIEIARAIKALTEEKLYPSEFWSIVKKNLPEHIANEHYEDVDPAWGKMTVYDTIFDPYKENIPNIQGITPLAFSIEQLAAHYPKYALEIAERFTEKPQLLIADLRRAEKEIDSLNKQDMAFINETYFKEEPKKKPNFHVVKPELPNPTRPPEVGGQTVKSGYSINQKGDIIEEKGGEDGRPTADSENRRGERESVLPGVREEHRRRVADERQGISQDVNAPHRLREACRTAGQGITHDPTGYDNHNFKEMQNLAASHGFDLIPFKDSTKSINAFISGNNIFLSMDKGDVPLINRVAHEISHHLYSQSTTKGKIDTTSQAFIQYRENLSKTVLGVDNYNRGYRVDIPFATEEYVADIESGMERIGGVLLTDGLKNGQTVDPIVKESESRKYSARKYSIRPQQDPPTSRDPKVLNLYLKDETDALIQTMMNKLHPPHMTWLETILKSPEWFGHPQIQNIVKLFMRDRNEIYHETFNELNMADDIDAPESTVTEAAKALKNKGLTLADRLAGKVSPEYQKLQEIIDEGDTSWKRNTSIPLDKQIKEFEKHIRQQGATEDTIRVWKLYRQSYDKALDLQTAQLRQMIEEITEEANFRGEKPDLNELRQTLKGALAQMEEWRGFYAPRLREQGNWKVQAYKEHGPMKENREWYREHRGSELSARRLANKMQREGWKIFSVGQVEKLPETIYQDVNATATAKLIDAALEKLSKKSALSNELTLKFNEEVLREVSNAIKARGFRSTMIRRGEKVVRGFIEDPIQRHLQYTNSLSGGIAKARVARMAMKEMLGEKFEGKQIGGIDPVQDPKAFQVAQNYIEEQLRNVEPIDRMIGLAKSIATFKFLGFNLRSLAVNTTAIITTAPAAIHQYALGGKGSLMGIIKELAVSGKDYGALMAGKKLANADEQAFLDEVQKKGWDDAQYTREALGEISKTHSRIWSSMMDGSMYLFGKSEKWNRGTTMLAAYRLARKQGMGHGEAAEVAKEASDKAHGVYGKSTMPMWAQGTNPAAKLGQLFYVYQKFGHNYLQMLYDMGAKKKNIKGMMFAFLSPLVLAGGAALPFKDALFSFAGFILKALFGEDRDPEKWVWDEIRKHLGLEAEKIGRHGLTGALGVDISGSLSAGVGIPKNFIDLTGAIGGVATELKEAKESIRNKQYAKAAEHLLPTGFANPLRAIRESSQGVTTRNNRPVWDEQGRPYKPEGAATVARTFGFRSTDQAVLSERTWEGHRQQADFADKRNAIYERYRAWTLGKRDRGEYKEIVKEVQDYNKKIRELRIPGVSPITSQSLQMQARRMAAPSKNERALLRN